MAFGYTIKDQFACHFVTFTVHQWVDVFTRQDYKDIIVQNLKFCQESKGLQILGWVLMSNHIHLLLRATKIPLSDVIRDYKKFTAKRIYAAIKENQNESRRAWLLWLLTKENHIWFWEEGYHGEEVYSEGFFRSKLNYIHQNPVRAGIVIKEEEYLYSSAGHYYGFSNQLIEIQDF